MRTLLDGIPPGRDEHVDDDQRHGGVAARRSTSPTPRSRASPSAELRGTTQNDIVKEYLSPRHVHLPARAEPPADRRHGRLVRASTRRSGTRSTSAATTCRRPGRRRCRRSPTRWRPRSACSTPCATRARSTPERFRAGVRLDLVLRQRRHPLRRGDLQAARLHRAVGPHRPRALRRHRSEGPPLPLRRAGQLRSGSPRRSPRTTCSASCWRCSAVTLSKRARARSIQLPAWNEALGLPRPWDQQWSLRMQQVLAFETDLLEYDDIFDGSHVDREAHDRELARRGLDRAATTCSRSAARSRPSTS